MDRKNIPLLALFASVALAWVAFYKESAAFLLALAVLMSLMTLWIVVRKAR